MNDYILRYGGTGAAPYGDPFTVRGSWPQWLQDAWVNSLASSGYAPQKAPWKPTYESFTVSWPTNDGALKTIALDPFEWPTRETADKLAAMYAIDGKPLVVIETPMILGPVASSALRRDVMFPNGKTLPVYQLAEYYTLNPEDKSTAADHLCRLLIARVWAGPGVNTVG